MNGPATSLRYLGNAEVEHTVKAIIHYQLMGRVYLLGFVNSRTKEVAAMLSKNRMK